ncbi:hypothetical protein B0T09DRAFT_102673 [Sordaria sp. MPI-SDFR-AT-0083]|nr:hypothetical protein B0T09DRAFT_102673 [Sordaria sp. MPI-SDFR-AT-0083]
MDTSSALRHVMSMSCPVLTIFSGLGAAVSFSYRSAATRLIELESDLVPGFWVFGSLGLWEGDTARSLLSVAQRPNETNEQTTRHTHHRAYHPCQSSATPTLLSTRCQNQVLHSLVST